MLAKSLSSMLLLLGLLVDAGMNAIQPGDGAPAATAARLGIRSLPEAARRHALRVGVDRIPAGKMLHRVWRFEPPTAPGGEEEFFWNDGARMIMRRDAFAQPLGVTDRIGKRLEGRRTWGSLHPFSALEAALERTDEAIRSDTWLSTPGSIAFVSGDSETTTLRFTPVDGVAALLVISADGDLLEAQVPEGGASHILFADFTPTGDGVRPLRRGVLSAPRRGFVERLVTTEIVEASPLPAFNSIVPWAWPTHSTSISTPFSVEDQRLTIATTLGGSTIATFVLDTGSDLSVVDTSLARALSLEDVGPFHLFINEAVRGSMVELPTLCVHGACIDRHFVGSIDLSQFPGTIPRGASGILGQDFFSDVVATIDFETSNITLTNRSSFRPGPDDVSIPAQRVDELLAVEATVAGRTGHFCVDTGQERAIQIVRIPDQLQLVNEEERQLYHPSGTTYVGTSAGAWPARGDLLLGPYKWKDLLLVVADPSSELSKTWTTSGQIGLELLRHFRVTFDMSGGRLWVVQIAPFARLERDCWLGVTTEQIDGALIVTSVRRAAGDSNSGLRPGDRILEVNQSKVSRMESGVELPSCRIGKPNTLVVKRKTVVKTVRVTGSPFP